MLCSLYNGNINVWNHENQQVVKIFEVCDLPVRAAKFVPRKNWIVAGSDDMQIRVFNYNTLDRVHAYEAHSDYVRCIVIHPTQPYILTSSGMSHKSHYIFLFMYFYAKIYISHCRRYVNQIVELGESMVLPASI